MDGRVVQILRPKDESFNLDTNVLFEILEKVGSCHFAVYSINGAKRSGKSFLLGQFLYFLKNVEDKEWFENSLKSKSVFYENSQTISRSGISCWSEPIFLEREGKKLAVLLMDCNEVVQVGDDEMTLRDNLILCAWSRLLSSIFIFNSMRGSDQQSLQSFCSSQEFLCYQMTNNDNRFEKENLYQNSVLLVHDWCSADYDFGYYDPKICSTQIRTIISRLEVNSVRSWENPKNQETILKYFEDASAYLLPHPGNSFAMYSKDNNLDPLFSKYSQQFVEIMKQNLKLKTTTTGRLVTGNEFKDHVKFWADILTCEKIPKAFGKLLNRCEEALSNGNSSVNEKETNPKIHTESNGLEGFTSVPNQQEYQNGELDSLSVPEFEKSQSQDFSSCAQESTGNEHIFGKDFVLEQEEKQLLEDWTNAGISVFFKNFDTLISKELQLNREDRKYQKASLASKVLGNTVAVGFGSVPIAGAFATGITKALVGGAMEKVGNVVLGNIDEEKRKNLLSWTNTLNKKAAKEFQSVVGKSMAYVCISYKGLLKSVLTNDTNQINFFHDTTRRIFNYLSEHGSTGLALSPEIVFKAFLNGRSVPHSLTTKRGLNIYSSNKKLNTREIFEGGIIMSDGFYVKGNADTKKIPDENEFRYVYDFENRAELRKRYKKIDLPNSNVLLQEDWRRIPNSIDDFMLEILKPVQEVDRKNSSDLEKENNEMLKLLLQKINSMGEKKVDEKNEEENLIHKWWPEQKVLVNAFYERKIDNKIIIKYIMDELLETNNKMIVITQKSKVSGLGGIGKTTTAKWFANHYQEDYDHIIWIDSGEESLLKSFKDLARDFKINYRHEMDLKNLARKCFEKMGEANCLWIFDNAESYQGEAGIKDTLPINYSNFHCIITSRNTDWGNKNGHGITDFQLDVFGINESYEFVKNALNADIQFRDSQLKTLCDMLGNLPLALQLTVATLNNGKLNINDMITKVDSSVNIFNEKFDDYEKTINKNMQISLDLIQKEPKGKIAFDILTIFGYIRPDDVDSEFLRRAGNIKKADLADAIELLEQYSLVTKTGKDTIAHNDSFWNKTKTLFRSQSQNVEVDLLSIHRLLQQTIRVNGKDTERKVLKKILQCEGYLELKMLPYTYADEKLKREFRSIGAQLIDQIQLEKLIASGNYVKAVDLAKFISHETQTSSSLYNYAVCLEKYGETKEALEILNKLHTEFKDEDNSENSFCEENAYDLMDLKEKLTKSIVWHKIILIHSNLLHKLFNEKRFLESIEPAKYLNAELQFQSAPATFNYALCLIKCGNLDEALELLQTLYSQVERATNISKVIEIDALVDLTGFKFDKLIVKTQIFFLRLKSLEYDKATEVFEDIFELIKFRKNCQRSQTMNLTYLLRILKGSDVKGFSFSFIDGNPVLKLTEISKRIELWDCSIEKSELPINLEQLILHRVSFLDQTGNTLQIFRFSSDIIGPKMRFLQLNCYTDIIISLEDITKLRSIYLNGCAILINKKVDKISPRELGLQNINFIQTDKNAEADAPTINLNEFFNFFQIRKLKLSGSNIKKNLVYDVTQLTATNETRFSATSNTPKQLTLQIEDIPSVEYLHLNECSLILRHGHRVAPKELQIEDVVFIRYNDLATDVHLKEFVDLKYMNKLNIFDKDVWVDMSDDIYVDTVTLCKPRIFNLEKAKWNVNKFYFFNVALMSSNLMTIKELKIQGSNDEPIIIDLCAIPETVEELTLGEGTKVKSTSLSFSHPNLKYLNIEDRNPSCVILFSQCTCIIKIVLQCETKDDLSAVVKYLKKPLKTVSIGHFIWETDAQFKKSSFPKLVDKKADYYYFENSKGFAIDKQKFLEC